MFVGVHERQLDPKGRLGLPASFRPRLEPRCYLSIGRDKCVDILTAEAFEAVAKDAVEKVRSGEMDRNQQRALARTHLKLLWMPKGESTLTRSCANTPVSHLIRELLSAVHLTAQKFGIQRAINALATKACSKLPALVNRETVEGRQVTNQRNV